jgi:glycerol kinase
VSRYVLALDQGTTSSRAIVFDRAGRAVAMAQEEFPQIFPQPGHVEHDPEDIWRSQLHTARAALAAAGAAATDLAAIGVTNQRETTVLWERATGRPVANAIVWQSRATAGLCERLKTAGHEPAVRAKTGLVIDAYFSASKIKHLLDATDGLRARAARGEVLFGTVDSFLIWRLTGGRVHVTDESNASRTLLYDIHRRRWDDDLLALFDVPAAMLPEVRASSEVYGLADPALFGGPVPVAGAAGDQQAALFGQACFEPGAAKNTYGTGCFMLLNIGESPVLPVARGPARDGAPAKDSGLITTIAWRLGDRTTYALEGSVFVAGAAVQWLRDGLRAITSSADVERLMQAVPDSGGVYLVPAFVGLGAPYWDPHARGTIIGLTRDSRIEHIARAAVDAMAYQTRDVLEAMQAEAGLTLSHLKVDGGAAANAMLLQFQADQLGVPVRRPVVAETTALGAAYLAGLAVGYWDGLDDIRANWALDREFSPSMPAATRARSYANWRRAVERSLHWSTG